MATLGGPNLTLCICWLSNLKAAIYFLDRHITISYCIRDQCGEALDGGGLEKHEIEKKIEGDRAM